MGYIAGDFNTLTKAMIMGELRQGHLQSGSGTGKVLCSLAKFKRGAKGQSDEYTYDLAPNTTRHHRGLTRSNLTYNPDSVSFRANWNYLLDDVVLDGIQLRNNNNLTVDQLVGMAEVGGNFSEDNEVQVASYGRTQIRRGFRNMLNAIDVSIWGKRLPNDQNSQLSGEAIPELMDPNADWNGGAPDVLGEWDETHPWVDGAPGSTLPASQKTLVNVPQIFGNSGTGRDLTISLIHQIHQVMSERFGDDNSIWLMPVSNFFFNKLWVEVTSLNNSMATFYTANFGRTASIDIEVIRIGNLFIYYDARANDIGSDGKVYGLHVGRNDGMEDAQDGAGLRVCFWVPTDLSEEQENLMDAINRQRFPDNIRISDFSKSVGGSNYWVPADLGTWLKSQAYDEAAYANIYLDYRIEGDRYKNYTIEDLNTS